MIVIVAGDGSILGADDNEVASLGKGSTGCWIDRIHPDDRRAAQQLLGSSSGHHVETVVLRAMWPKLGYRRVVCAAIATADFILVEQLIFDEARVIPFKEMEAVVVAVERATPDDLICNRGDPIYRSMLIGAVRRSLPDFHATCGGEVGVLSHERPCTDVIPQHSTLTRRTRLEVRMGSSHIEVVGRVTTVSLRRLTIEFRTGTAPAVIVPRADVEEAGAMVSRFGPLTKCNSPTKATSTVQPCWSELRPTRSRDVG